MKQKQVIIIAGPNGVGKTTWATEFLLEHSDYLFLNADNIAKEMTPENPRSSAISAGRVFLASLPELVEQNRSFVIESTLSGRYLIRSIKDLHERGYRVKIVFIFVESSDILIERIKNRVAKGGHYIPDDDVRRRWGRGWRNFWTVYRNLVDSWSLFYNEGGQFVQVATGVEGEIAVVADDLFERCLELLDET